MLQAAAARLTVPLQRIRCMTCRYQHHCQLIAPCKYKCSLEFVVNANSEQRYPAGSTTHNMQAHHPQAAHDTKHRVVWFVKQLHWNASCYHTNTHRDCKTSLGYYPLHDHCVTAAYLCLDKSIRHGCCDLHQHSGQVVIGLFACRH